MQFDVVDLADRLDGELHVVTDATSSADVDGSAVVDGLAIDSRLVRPGQLFAALRADRDGHEFVEAAFERGAGAALVDRDGAAAGWSGTTIRVASVPDALAELARAARDRLPERVVGVTGSVGKTTTKDLLANVLGRSLATVASERSFNNELGVPLTLANAAAGTEAAVVEMGARGAGHIRLLCEMARPTIGVLTVVEGVHTEVMGGIDRIALAKRELVEDLPASGLAVLNLDDTNVAAMAAHTPAAVLTYGTDARGGAEVTATEVSVEADLRARFTLRSPWGPAEVHLGVRGAHNVVNALAAAATALWLGMAPAEVAAGLAEAPASPWRMELVAVEGGPRVLNDAYNAGPASMAAALRALAELALPARGRRLALLGVMAELGSEGPEAHRRISGLASELGIEVISVGCDLYGVPESCDGIDEALEALAARRLGADDVVLVKGSRVAGLERAAEALTRPGRR